MAKGKTTTRRRRRRKRSRNPTRLPLIPTLVFASPELTVGIHAAADMAAGVPPQEAGVIALQRLKALYGASPAQKTTISGVDVEYSVSANAKAKILGAAIHALARALRMRVPVNRRLSLF